MLLSFTRLSLAGKKKLHKNKISVVRGRGQGVWRNKYLDGYFFWQQLSNKDENEAYHANQVA